MAASSRRPRRSTGHRTSNATVATVRKSMIRKQSGKENQYKLHEEMGKVMTDNVTVIRYNDRLKATDAKLLEMMDRYRRISINDSNLWATMALPHARHLDNM